MTVDRPPHIRHSQLLTAPALLQMTVGAKVLEQDQRGVKVYKLANGDILKIFRLRSRFSGARIYSYARRFCRNAARLQGLGVPTVSIKQLYHLQASTDTAVLYQPLAGQTLRDMAHSAAIPLELFDRLGEFIAQLHAHGVHFRSMHPGNIVLTPQGSLGLIDISDMSIYPWGLQCSTRLRSIKHFYRYPAEIHKLGAAGCVKLWKRYFEKSSLSTACQAYLQQGIAKLSARKIED